MHPECTGNRASERMKTSQPTHDARLCRVLIALQKCPTRRTKELAAMVSLHPAYLRYLFRKKLGMTVTAYSIGLRLRYARELLVESKKSIKEIRNEVGIPNAANFVRSFRKHF